MARFITPTLLFREAIKINDSSKLPVALGNFHRPVFCLSDNPIIWKTFPVHPTDFTTPFIFPINKEKVFLVLDQNEYSFTRNDISIITIILMHQAKKYVAFHNKEALEHYVNAYQKYREYVGDDQQNIVAELFERIKTPANSPQMI